MDSLARVTRYFPAGTLTVYWIFGNLIINNEPACYNETRALLIALIVVCGVVCFATCFTDTYENSKGMKTLVLLMPTGPVAPAPTPQDEEKIFDYFFIKKRDIIHALIATATFVLIAIFCLPTSGCLFPAPGKLVTPPPPAPVYSWNGTLLMPPPSPPSPPANWTFFGSSTPPANASYYEPQMVSSFSQSVVRTVPVIVALISSVIMMCLGTPRQLIGGQNVEETAPSLERQLGDNPIYNDGGNIEMGMGPMGMDPNGPYPAPSSYQPPRSSYMGTDVPGMDSGPFASGGPADGDGHDGYDGPEEPQGPPQPGPNSGFGMGRSQQDLPRTAQGQAGKYHSTSQSMQMASGMSSPTSQGGGGGGGAGAMGSMRHAPSVRASTGQYGGRGYP